MTQILMGNNGNSFKDHIFNIVRQRASPTKVVLESGHTVEKEEYVYFQRPNDDASGPGDWMRIKCADYHGEHFVYIDPLYNMPPKRVDPNVEITGRGHWWSMCTCGGPAVMVDPREAQYEETGTQENLLVCYFYHKSLRETGVGSHADQQGRNKWW